MQTFLPYADFRKSASVLDSTRLGKQRVECKQIYLALTNQDYGWQHHPAVKMWRGYELALAAYGLMVCIEWRTRKYRDSLMPYFASILDDAKWHGIRHPEWFGDDRLHVSHMANLLRKDYDHYSKYFSGVDQSIEYYWPV